MSAFRSHIFSLMERRQKESMSRLSPASIQQFSGHSDYGKSEFVKWVIYHRETHSYIIEIIFLAAINQGNGRRVRHPSACGGIEMKPFPIPTPYHERIVEDAAVHSHCSVNIVLG